MLPHERSSDECGSTRGRRWRRFSAAPLLPLDSVGFVNPNRASPSAEPVGGQRARRNGLVDAAGGDSVLLGELGNSPPCPVGRGIRVHRIGVVWNAAMTYDSFRLRRIRGIRFRPASRIGAMPGRINCRRISSRFHRVDGKENHRMWRWQYAGAAVHSSSCRSNSRSPTNGT